MFPNSLIEIIAKFSMNSGLKPQIKLKSKNRHSHLYEIMMTPIFVTLYQLLYKNKQFHIRNQRPQSRSIFNEFFHEV
jgi:hypothetical protein